ncbi:MAG: hypothetical protein EHJ95_01395 [Methanobacteriota archaeon]|nr:MAG: hypothetical protein EHJ95_01395 [Euryarchaeota archaeon]
MTSRWGKILPVLFAAVFLVGLALSGIDGSAAIVPDPGSRFHTNPAYLSRISDQGTEKIIDLSSALLDQGSAVLFDIEAGDYTEAERDLERYRFGIKGLEAAVGRYGLSETDFRLYRMQHQVQYNALKDLLNATRELTSIGTPAKGNTGSWAEQTRVRAAAFQIHVAAARYTSGRTMIIEFGGMHQLNVTPYEKGQRALEGIEGRVNTRIASFPVAGAGATPVLSLAVEPDKAFYHDQISFTGTYLPSVPGDDRIGIFIDTDEVAQVQGDRASGTFSHRLEVNALRPGRHVVYAKNRDDYSDIRTIRIDGINTTLTLDASPVIEDRTVYAECRGMLLANGEPVAGAPVTLFMNDRSPTVTYTDAFGSYYYRFEVTRGVYEFRARFASDELPLMPSDSVANTIDVKWYPQTLQILVYAAGLVIAVGSALWYTGGLSPRRPASTGSAASALVPSPRHVNRSRKNGDRDLRSRATRWFRRPPQGGGGT